MSRIVFVNNTAIKIVSSVLCLSVLFSISSVALAEELTADKMLDFARMTSKHKEALFNGEILVVDTGTDATADLTSSDLYSGLVIFVQESFKTVMEAIQEASHKSSEEKIIWELTPADSFPNIDFKVEDSKEVERMLRFSKGRDVNLSSGEVDILKNLGISLPLDATELTEFSKAYQSILERRFQSYTQKGLDGIAPYTRGKGKSESVSDDLRAVTNMLGTTIERFVPDFYKDIHQYPKVTDRPQQYLLVREAFENRPLYVLVHRMADITNSYAFILNREYFVGHSYDAMQVTFLCVPYHKGTLIGLSTDVITDKVAGIGMKTRHKVGRKKIRSIAERRLLDVKKSIEAYSLNR
jgi:hypothetical protein